MQQARGLSGKRVRQSHACWLEHIEDCSKKGESAQTYCARNDLSLIQFKKHERRAKHETGAALFAPVSILAEAQSAGCEIEVIYPRGIRLCIKGQSLDKTFKAMECYL